MRHAYLLPAVAVTVLVVTAGCGAPFAGQVSEGSLDEEPNEPYDWNTTKDVTFTVREGSYQAVYDLNDTTTVELYEVGLSTDRPLTIWAVRYRYPNGTTLTGTELNVYRQGSSRVIEVPNASGKLAYTAESGRKQFGQESFLTGTVEVILPPGRRASAFLFGKVQPGGYETHVDDHDRLHIVWNEPVSNGVFIRYYLIRDITLFRMLIAILVGIALAGLMYYYRKIRRLENRRKEMGLDVDTGDDEFDDRGPPGFQ